MKLTQVLVGVHAVGLHLAAGLAVKQNVVQHEIRSQPLQGARRMAPMERLPLRFGLKMNPKAAEEGHNWLMDVADPTSPKYGRFWSSEEVHDAFAPSSEAVDSIKQWLATVGKISNDRISTTANKAWLAVDVSVSEAEALLNTEYYWHGEEEHLVGCNAYHIPEHIQEHLELITPAVKSRQMKRLVKTAKRAPQSGTPKANPVVFTQSNAANASSLSDCANNVTPACVQALYQFPQQSPNAKVSPNNSMAILQFGYYAQADLNSFYQQFAPWVPANTAPTLQGINGGIAAWDVAHAGGETELDFEMAIPIVYPQKTIDYAIYNHNYADGGTGSFNSWLDALDGSYCTYDGGDDTASGIDPTYPDPDGWNHPRMCGKYKPANVISISWGNGEQVLPAAYQQRMCQEFMKLGLQGVSLFQASGDYGVAQNANANDDGCLKDGTVFDVGFPNSCPYMTSVGGSQIQPGKTVNDPEMTYYVPTGNPNITYAGGGGFSNIYSVPDYQKSTIENYFAKHNPPYSYYHNGSYANSTHGRYNREGRGLPDVSALATNISIVIAGNTGISGGTSAATPMFAAIINRIIEQRIAAGKGPLGFVNPAFYQNPSMFNDITIGHTAGCGTKGFSAVQGWDPATGLGSPNYPRMLQYFMSLP